MTTFVSDIFGYQGNTNKHRPTQTHWNVANTKHMHCKAIHGWKWLGSWKKKKKKKTLEKHFISQDMLFFVTNKMILVWILSPIRILVLHHYLIWHHVVSSTNNQNQSELHYCYIIRRIFYHFMYCMYVLMFRNTKYEKISKCNCNIMHYFDEVIVM